MTSVSTWYMLISADVSNFQITCKPKHGDFCKFENKQDLVDELDFHDEEAETVELRQSVGKDRRNSVTKKSPGSVKVAKRKSKSPKSRTSIGSLPPDISASSVSSMGDSSVRRSVRRRK
jgi:hypothetical protein